MTADNAPDGPSGGLAAREVCQILREVVFERRTMTKVGSQTWDEVYTCHFIVDVEGWRIPPLPVSNYAGTPSSSSIVGLFDLKGVAKNVSLFLFCSKV